MFYATIYAAAAASSALTFYASGWSFGLAPGALAVAAIALIAVLLAWLIPRPIRAAWHRRRATACSRAAETSSGLWPLAWVGWLLISLIEWAHIVRAEQLT